MRIDDELRYPASPDAVAVMMADPGFIRAKCELMESTDVTVDVTGDPARGFTVTSTRKQSTDEVPDAIRSLIGSSLQIRETQIWQAPSDDGSRTGTIEVDVVGMPVKFSGELRLRPDGGDTVETLSGDLKASIPFMGAKVESAAEPAVRGGIRAEGRAGQTWLAAR